MSTRYRLFVGIMMLEVAGCGRSSEPAKPAAPSTAEKVGTSAKTEAPPVSESGGPSPATVKNAPLTATPAAEPAGPVPTFTALPVRTADVLGVRALTFSPVDDGVITGGATSKKWSVGSAEPTDELDIAFEVKAAAYSPDGSLLAIGGDQPSIVLWDNKDKMVKQEIEAFDDGVISVAFSPDGSLLAASGYSKEVKIWKVGTGELVRAIDVGDRSVSCVAFSPTGDALVTTGQSVHLWNPATGAAVRELKPEEERARVMSAAFSPDGKMVATAEGGWTIMLWATESGKPVATLPGHEGPVNAVAFSPDGAYLASASQDGTVAIWRPSDGKLLQKLVAKADDQTQDVYCVAWSRDGTFLGAGCEDGTLRLWSTKPVKTETKKPASEPTSQASPAPVPKPEKPVAKEPAAAAPAELPVAATQEDLARILDLSKIAKLENAQVFTEKAPYLNYVAPGTVQSAKEFYSKVLSEAGWKPENSVDPMNDDSFATLPVSKDGYFVMAEFQGPSLQRDAGKVFVTIENRGNIDPRSLPRPADIESPGGSREDSSYSTKMNPDEFAEFIVKSMLAAGWQQGEGLEFTRNAMKLSVNTVSAGDGKIMVFNKVSVDH